MVKVAEEMGVRIIYLQSKDCDENNVEIHGAVNVVVEKISSVLQFTASEGFKPSFDLLSTAGCDNLQCLYEFTEKQFKHDISMWIKARLKMLMRFIDGNKVIIPTCLRRYDELAKRLTMGLLYVLRDKIAVPLMVDDMMSLITNELYSDAFSAMMRPYWFVKNKNLENRELLIHNPIVITPCTQGGFYRLAEPHKYVVLFDNERWTLPRKDIEKIVYS